MSCFYKTCKNYIQVLFNRILCREGPTTVAFIECKKSSLELRVIMMPNSCRKGYNCIKKQEVLGACYESCMVECSLVVLVYQSPTRCCGNAARPS